MLGSYDHQAPRGTAAGPLASVTRGGGDLRVLFELQAPPNQATESRRCGCYRT